MSLPNWPISAILALLLGLYTSNRVRGKEHGADQPQDPVTKEFITEENDFWRWLLSGLAVAVITAYLVPRVTPTLNSVLQGVPLLTKLVIGIWVLVLLKEVYTNIG